MENKKAPEQASPYENRIITIPNLLSFFRILLLPLFVYLYLHAGTTWEYLSAAIVLAVSALTDLIDGKIARRFHMISKLGKVLDPIADKLTHITIAFCLCWRIPQMLYVFILLLVKEFTMMFLALYGTFRKNKKIWDSAQWYGKVCTTIVFIIFITLALFPNIPTPTINILLIVCSVSLLGSLILYIRMFWLLNSKKHNPDTEEETKTQ